MRLLIWHYNAKSDLNFDFEDGVEVLVLQICSLFGLEEFYDNFEEQFALLDSSGRLVTSLKDFLYLQMIHSASLLNDAFGVELWLIEKLSSACSSDLFPSVKFTQVGYRYDS